MAQMRVQMEAHKQAMEVCAADSAVQTALPFRAVLLPRVVELICPAVLLRRPS